MSRSAWLSDAPRLIGSSGIWTDRRLSLYARIRAGISATGSTWSTSAVKIALRGMSLYSASSGSCAKQTPPSSLTRFMPIDPFAPVPERITDTALE